MNRVEQTHQSRQWVFFCTNAKASSLRYALAKRMGERETAIAVGQPLSLMREGYRSLARRHRKAGPAGRFIEYQPLHYPVKVPGLEAWLTAKNARRLRDELDELMPRGPGGQRIVCFDSPHHYRLARALDETTSVYLAIDDRTRTLGGDPIAGEVAAERELLARVSLVICVSESLAQTIRGRLPETSQAKVSVLPNGYDDEVFDAAKPASEPAALAAVARPRLLIAGHVSERMDWEGLSGLANRETSCSLVFVGPLEPDQRRRLDALRAMAADAGNAVHYFEPVPLAEMPAWMAHCDAGLVPYRLNRFTLASDPLKSIEYLAMGLPVLATRVPGMQRFEPNVLWVETGEPASYRAAFEPLRAAMADAVAARGRMEAAGQHALSRRVEEFLALLAAAGSR